MEMKEMEKQMESQLKHFSEKIVQLTESGVKLYEKTKKRWFEMSFMFAKFSLS